MKTRLAFILTVYNRKSVTLESLKRLNDVINNDNYVYDIYLTDDGCTDGTSEAILAEIPNVTIINGDGNLFWSGGMREAWKKAASIKNYDFYIWFNDDVYLYDNALDLLFEPISKLGLQTIVSGAFCDDCRHVSYGGRKADWEWVTPSENYPDVYYLNGNFVLIPSAVFKKLGFIDIKYTHDLGDFDYGLRARKIGIRVVLTSGFVGLCNRHDADAFPSFDPAKSIVQRFRILYGPKFNVIAKFRFDIKYKSIFIALKQFVWMNLRTLITKRND